MKMPSLPAAIIVVASALGTSSCATADEFNDSAPTSRLETERAWIKTSHVQLDVARANLAILSARSAYLIDDSPEDAIIRLNKADGYLAAAHDKAGQGTRSRILILRAVLAETKTSISSQGMDAGENLNQAGSWSEVLMAEALAESQFTSLNRNKDMSARIAIARARAELLSAQAAFRTGSAREEVSERFDQTEQRLRTARDDATGWTRSEIDDLRTELQRVRASVDSNADAAHSRLNQLTDNMKSQLDKMERDVVTSDEIEWVRTQYAHIEAQAALQRAQLAERSDATHEQAISHLENARMWIQRSKSNVSTEARIRWADLETRVTEAKSDISQGRRSTQNTIADLLDRAAEAVRADEETDKTETEVDTESQDQIDN